MGHIVVETLQELRVFTPTDTNDTLAAMITRKAWLIFTLCVVGFLTGAYVATGHESSTVKALILCPPAILMALVPTDPKQSDIWILIAPLNACLYACVGLTIWELRRYGQPF